MASISVSLSASQPYRAAPLRVVGYVHDPSKTSLEDRIDYLSIGGAVENLYVLHTFADIDALGSSAERPGLERAIAYVASRKATGILVESIGRLVRQSNIALELYDRLEALGASLWDQRLGRISPAKVELAGRYGGKRLRTSRANMDHPRIHGGWPKRLTH